MQVYLNGAFVDADAAVVPVDDRGFLFADGVYDVTRVYPSGMFLAEAHIARLRAGLQALRIDAAPADELLAVSEQLLERNGLRGRDATIYMQVTRGVAPRKHAFPPAGTKPTVFVAARPFKFHPDSYFTEGVPAITVPDTRWSRCDIKSIALLPNVLANEAAHAAGCFEALFVRDGVVIEGSHSNLCAVLGGRVITYPSCNYILSGITRNFVLNLAHELAIPVRETGLLWEQLYQADELFLTGTTTDVMPIVRVDDRPIADGRPGPVTLRLLEALRRATG